MKNDLPSDGGIIFLNIGRDRARAMNRIEIRIDKIFSWQPPLSNGILADGLLGLKSFARHDTGSEFHSAIKSRKSEIRALKLMNS